VGGVHGRCQEKRGEWGGGVGWGGGGGGGNNGQTVFKKLSRDRLGYSQARGLNSSGRHAVKQNKTWWGRSEKYRAVYL